MTRDEALILISEIHARGSISTLEADALHDAFISTKSEKTPSARRIMTVKEGKLIAGVSSDLVTEPLGQSLTDDADTFGARVRSHRQELGWSQEKLANVAGISQTTIDKIERSIIQRSKFSMRIAHALGIPRESILSFCEVPDVVS